MLFGSRDVEILSLRGDANRIFAKEVGCGVWGVGCGVWGVGCGMKPNARIVYATANPSYWTVSAKIGQ